MDNILSRFWKFQVNDKKDAMVLRESQFWNEIISCTF